jgi:hypothetical protein
MFHLQHKFFYLIVCLILVPFIQAQDEQKSYISNDERLLMQKEHEEKSKQRNLEYSQLLQSELVSGPDSTPLIELIENKQRLLSIKDYNTRIEWIYSSAWHNYLNFIDDSIPDHQISTVKKSIIKSVLKDAYITAQWNIAKNSRAFNDSVANETIRTVQDMRTHIPDSILKILYQQYYPYLFSEKNNSLYYVIVSTDSTLLLDLLTAVRESFTNQKNKKEDNKRPIKIRYTADVFAFDSLPEIMKIVADTLYRDQWSKITKAPWGYFALGLYRYNINKKVPFEESIGQLIYLPEMSREKTTVTDVQAYEFFRDNKQLFEPGDTLFLTLKIIPYAYSLDSYYNAVDFLLPQSQDIAAFSCKNTDLPATIKDYMSSIDTCKHLREYNGIWNICLNSKKQSSPVNFESCKNQVKEYIIASQKENLITDFSSKAHAKENDRSRGMFYNNFMNFNNQNSEELNSKVQKWAESNIKIYLQSKF